MRSTRKPDFGDRIGLAFSTCIFAGLLYLLCFGMYQTVVYSFTHGAGGGFDLFMFCFSVPLWILSLFCIPALFFITIMFLGWTLGYDWFRMEGDKYDQVEFNFREK